MGRVVFSRIKATSIKLETIERKSSFILEFPVQRKLDSRPCICVAKCGAIFQVMALEGGPPACSFIFGKKDGNSQDFCHFSHCPG